MLTGEMPSLFQIFSLSIKSKDVNGYSNIRIFVFVPNIRIRFLNSNIRIFFSVPAFFVIFFKFLAHLSRRLIGELIVYPRSGVRRPSYVVRRPSSVVHNA